MNENSIMDIKWNIIIMLEAELDRSQNKHEEDSLETETKGFPVVSLFSFATQLFLLIP